MSIILKGIDLPTYDSIVMFIRPNGTVIYCDDENISKETEAIQIPKGHGRLIDETKINDALLRDDGRQFDTDAPTILEAEE